MQYLIFNRNISNIMSYVLIHWYASAHMHTSAYTYSCTDILIHVSSPQDNGIMLCGHAFSSVCT